MLQSIINVAQTQTFAWGALAAAVAVLLAGAFNSGRAAFWGDILSDDGEY